MKNQRLYIVVTIYIKIMKNLNAEKMPGHKYYKDTY